jgi:hypothetical protein
MEILFFMQKLYVGTHTEHSVRENIYDRAPNKTCAACVVEGVRIVNPIVFALQVYLFCSVAMYDLLP